MFIVFDLETTGFDASKDDVIQFAYIAFQNNHAIRSEVLYFYYEGMSWSEDAFNIHHISQDFLKQYKDDFNKNLVRMFTVLGGANVCGFNSDKFDCPFAKRWLARMGINGLEYRVQQDIMLAYRPVMHQPMFSLIKLTETMKVSQKDVQSMARLWFKENAGTAAHDASYDVAATAIFTLQGVTNGLISFDDTAVQYVETERVVIPQQQLIETSSEIKQRDPKGMLVYLDETPYILNSNKAKYMTHAVMPYELNDYANSGKMMREIFHVGQNGSWEAQSGNITYILVIGKQRDTLHVQMPTKTIQAF